MCPAVRLKLLLLLLEPFVRSLLICIIQESHDPAKSARFLEILNLELIDDVPCFTGGIEEYQDCQFLFRQLVQSLLGLQGFLPVLVGCAIASELVKLDGGEVWPSSISRLPLHAPLQKLSHLIGVGAAI